jgi:hypothetical protein
MPRIKIKQMEERVSTQGLHMGGDNKRRKLEPGEVIDISEDFLLPDGRALLDVLWSTNKCEMTLDPVTRPLDYKNYREAKLCSPTFKPRGTSEIAEMHIAREAVAERLSETASDAPETTDSLADDAQPKAAPAPVATPKQRREKATEDRRAARRAALQAVQRGEAITT